MLTNIYLFTYIMRPTSGKHQRLSPLLIADVRVDVCALDIHHGAVARGQHRETTLRVLQVARLPWRPDD